MTKTLLEALAVPYPSPDPSNPHAIDLAWTSRMYKTLLQGGHFNKKTQTVDPTSSWEPQRFAASFINTIPQNIVVAMCTEGERNGSFVVATLCEILVRDGDERKKERQKLKSWFGEKERKVIKEGDGRGKDLLLEKLALL